MPQCARADNDSNVLISIGLLRPAFEEFNPRNQSRPKGRLWFLAVRDGFVRRTNVSVHLMTRAVQGIQKHGYVAAVVRCQVGLAVVIKVPNSQDTTDDVGAVDSAKFSIPVTQ